MSYVVLARRYRPQRFQDLVGQEHVAHTLKNAISQERFAHAYLFTGPRGVGKTSAARILAKAIRCLDPQDGEPCNKCEACTNINDGQSLDVIEIDAASNTGVDNIRELRENVEYMASVGKYRVYIIDEVHMLSTAAFNALLKTLEEPPPHVIFIFATTELHKVLATIQSRCQRFDFRRIPEAMMMENLKGICEQEGIEIDEASLRSISVESEGCLRDAQSLLDQAIAMSDGKIGIQDLEEALGLIGRAAYIEFFESIIKKDTAKSLNMVHEMLLQGHDPKVLLGKMTQFFRDWHLSYFSQKNLIKDPDFGALFDNLKGELQTDEVVRNLDLCLKHQSQLYSASNTEFLLESLAVKLTLIRPIGSMQAVAAAPASTSTPTSAQSRPSQAGYAQNRPARPTPPAQQAQTQAPQQNQAATQARPTPPPPPQAAAPAAATGELSEQFSMYLRQNKPAWTPVLQSLLSMDNVDGVVQVKVKDDFAGKRLASADGHEVLKLALKIDKVEVQISASDSKKKTSHQDSREELYKKHKAARDMAREHESVASAVKIFDAKIKETKVLIDPKKG